jgi:hypothetical protein
MGETATAQLQAIHRKAVERYRKDARFAHIVKSIVAKVMSDHGPVGPDRADREAYDIAERVAAMVLESLYHEDQELGHQRALADHWQKLAEDTLALSPRPPVIFPSSLVPLSQTEG